MCVFVTEPPSHVVVEFEGEESIASVCTKDVISGNVSVGGVCSVKWGKQKFKAKVLGLGKYILCVCVCMNM